MVFLNILPKIDFFFESSSFVINSINGTLSKKIHSLIPWINLSYYRNVIKINSRYFGNKKNFQTSEEYIVFIDGMVIDHPDVILRQGEPQKENRKKYYECIRKINI